MRWCWRWLVGRFAKQEERVVTGAVDARPTGPASKQVVFRPAKPYAVKPWRSEKRDARRAAGWPSGRQWRKMRKAARSASQRVASALSGVDSFMRGIET